MRFIAPRTGAPEHTIAENQEEYSPVTVCYYVMQYPEERLQQSGVLWRATFTPEERERIAAGADVFLMQFYPTSSEFKGITPMDVNVGPRPEWMVPDHE